MGALLHSSVRLTVLSHLQYVTGDWSDAVVSAERAMALASEIEHPHSAFVWWAAIACPPPRRPGPPPTPTRGGRRRADRGRDRPRSLGMTSALVATARGDAEAVLAALEPVAALSPNPGIDEPGFWPWHDLYGDLALVAVEARGEPTRSPHEGAGGRARPRGTPIAKSPACAGASNDARAARAGRQRRSSARSSTSSRSGCPTSRR